MYETKAQYPAISDACGLHALGREKNRIHSALSEQIGVAHKIEIATRHIADAMGINLDIHGC
jgi:hypothetical protein